MNYNDFTRILHLIELKFGRGSSADWKNRDFEDLNFEITKKTKTNISAHTLKRVFGKIKTDEYYLPQKATMQALKQFVDYENIESNDINEKIEDTKTEIQIAETPTETTPEIGNGNKKFKIGHFILLATILITGSITAYYLLDNTKQSTKLGEIKILSTEGRIPTSAQFEYTTPNNTDSFGICYDGNYFPIPIANGKKMKSNYYYQYPGLFRVRMWKDNNVIVSSTKLVYVQTKGWEVFGYISKQKQMERYYNINLKQCMQDSIYYPSKKVIQNAGMDTTKLAEITLNNYHPTGIIGDNFILETTLKNPEHWLNATCNSVMLYIVGKKESIMLHFANPGCSYWIQCRLSERKLDKRNENLKNFTFDLTKWQHFRVVNTNKHIKISVNNIERFSSTYNESIGEIMGVTIRFQGNGYLKDYRLSDKNGKAIFSFPEVTNAINEVK